MKRTVQTYEELHTWAIGFAEGRFEAFIVNGLPGLGKSRILKQAVKGKAHLIEGRATAFQLYRELYEHQDELILIDDVDQLYTDRDAVRLLKCVCQTERVKTVAWHTATPKLESEGIPLEFKTRSKVGIIANVWKELNANVGAVEDRGILIDFRPTAEAVHAWAGTWYRQQRVSAEVYDFIGSHLRLITEPSGRHYVTAQQVKRAGLDWQRSLYETWNLDEEVMVILELLRDTSLTQKQREQAFKEKTGRSKSTFFRRLKEFGLKPQDLECVKP